MFCPKRGRGHRFASGSVSVEQARDRLCTSPVMVVGDEIFTCIENISKSVNP
ncbi:MAG TPA: hypothetical protein VLS27_11000 [Gammaproteobacteria bacterium]|nr:hypothetical protein [Gammaproteobacteria bacterium]